MSLVNTLMTNIRVDSGYDKYERRASRYGAWNTFQIQTDDPMGIITPELEQAALASIGRTLQVPVIDYDGSVTVGSSRSATIADDENTSQLVTVSFTTYAFGFTMVPSLYMNNEIGYERDFGVKLTKYLHQLAANLDTACISALSSAKTQVYADDLGLYTPVGNVAQVAQANKTEIFGDLNVMMEANDYFDQLFVIGNGGVQSQVRKVAEDGLYNDKDKRYQWDDKVWNFSNRISNAADRVATGYAVNAGSLGLLYRVEREALRATVARTGHEWDTSTLPLLDIPVGTYYYESVGDFSAIAGAASADMDRVLKQHFGFAVDVAVVTPYNSAQGTIASPVMAFEIANT